MNTYEVTATDLATGKRSVHTLQARNVDEARDVVQAELGTRLLTTSTIRVPPPTDAKGQ